MSNQENIISIVGAGVSGIICALTLANFHLGSKKTIRVFEHKRRVGGRAHAIKIQEQFIDLGAGRFSPQLHKNINELVAHFNIENESFPFTQLTRPQELHSQLKEILNKLKPMCDEHKDDSFINFLTAYLGEDQSKDIINALGYDSLALPFITPNIAYDIIEKHPEIQGFSDNAGYTWRNLKEGFCTLPQILYDRAVELGVEFHFDYELITIDNHEKTPALTLKTSNDDIVRITQGDMIVTLPPTAMSRLNCNFPQDWTHYTYGSIPLFKGFLFYEKPWWQDLSLTDHVIITNNPIRKLYFKDKRYIFFYTDSDFANYWQETSQHGEAHYLKTIKEFMADAIQCDVDHIPDPIEHTHKYWIHGVEFSKECSPTHPLSFVHKKSKIISASDAYTPHCGWMEGGVMAGKSAALKLLKRLEAEEESQTDNHK
ncbi:FAD-dependent oxidoreductase [Pseudoalteromonas tunicata]|uniref:FAD-dependent oxidoreductase n=1 Tax=Pseudoalteromonas tunicata TaxID=314281 RepID=UPI00273EE7E3|nr:FAD-dependent oxidoreductase [Pseudoalteromonas tunicata]MDP5212115.1 FAD-dependent oxidoreductase [Pseudoalteromonas tunicata]